MTPAERFMYRLNELLVGSSTSEIWFAWYPVKAGKRLVWLKKVRKYSYFSYDRKTFVNEYEEL